MKIDVAIAEDNDFLAESIIEKLELFSSEINYCFRGNTGLDLLDKLKNNNLPQIILMDIEMPEMDGIIATSKVCEIYPDIKIIMLTVFDDEEKIFRAIQAGANGYLLKDETPDKIFESIKMILVGGAPMSPSIAAKSLQLLRNPIEVQNKINEEDFSLSKREVEVLEKLSEGLDYNNISTLLFISPSTVRKHIENIYKKLQVNNKMTAVQKAIRHKII